MARERAELVDQQAAVLTRPDIVLRTGRPRLRPGRLAVATGIAESNGYAKTLIASASREKP
jgi:hypothetical protein